MPLSIRSLRREISRLGRELGDKTRSARRVLRIDDPYHVVPYRGYGNTHTVLVQGRALQDEGIVSPNVADPAWRNLLNSFKRVETDALAGARLRVRIGSTQREIVADEEGFIAEWVDLAAPLPPDAGWHPATLELVSPLRDPTKPVATTAQILVPPSSATFGVISDIDDTVLQSNVANLLQAARNIAFRNARTRLPFPGVAAFYRALHHGPGGAVSSAANPIFYVSSSPWNLYDVITDFLELQGIPAGPVLLRDWDLRPGAAAAKGHHTHKLSHIKRLFATYPSLPFILIGDSTEQDPEIYHQVVAEHPSRVLAVYIRNVHAQPQRSAAIRRLAKEILAAHSTLILSVDTLACAKHAAEKGWISPDALPSIGEEKKADQGKTGEKVGPPSPAAPTTPTVVVSDDPAAQVKL
ncbi:MAG TPA: phosphatase domain-containing protein [Opitutaceae bacterium]|nr:phosphatase domain-containing protein [Opitutaceae bacterium]